MTGESRVIINILMVVTNPIIGQLQHHLLVKMNLEDYE